MKRSLFALLSAAALLCSMVLPAAAAEQISSISVTGTAAYVVIGSTLHFTGNGMPTLMPLQENVKKADGKEDTLAILSAGGNLTVYKDVLRQDAAIMLDRPGWTMNAVRDIALTNGGQYALTTSGELYAKGDIFGNSSIFADAYYPDAEKIQSTTAFSAIDGGINHILLQGTDGFLYAMGNTSNGQCGTAPEDGSVRTPRRLYSGPILDFSAGYGTSYYVTENGDLYGLGLNNKGQLGLPADNITHWKQVHIASNVTAVSAGYGFVLYITNTNNLYGLGETENGELGTNAQKIAAAPLLILTNVQSAAAGKYSSFAVKNDGALYAFGQNIAGQLGDGYLPGAENKPAGYNTANATAPTPVLAGQIDYAAYFKDKNDLPNNWAMEEVYHAETAGLVPTALRNRYKQDISREDFAILSTHLLTVKTGKSLEDIVQERTGRSLSSWQNDKLFTDSSSKEVISAAALGIVEGRGNNIFDPKGNISRQEAAKMLTKTAEALGCSTAAQSYTFADAASISDWAQPSAAFVAENGIMMGVGNNMFDPKGFYSRQQSYLTILRLFNNL